MNNTPDVIFPNLGIQINNLNPIAVDLFGLKVHWYGVIIGSAVLLGLLLVRYRAKQSGQNPDTYLDFLLYALITSIVGARLYYVIFAWDQYKDDLLKIFALRQGGLAIYGAVIASIITAYVFTKKKKISFYQLVDTAAPALILGQALGRWGNFINQEAFGGYTDSLLAMNLKLKSVYNVPQSVLDKTKIIDGIEYIQVHPTFLYESLWNFVVFIFLLVYSKHKKFEGEIFGLYILGYALGRVWIEGLRTDQLIIGNTGIPVSQLLAAICIVASVIFVVYKRKKCK